MATTTITAQAADLGYNVAFKGDGTINYVMPISRSAYTPEIYGGREMFGEIAPWTIQTTAYGTMSSEDIDLVIAGYRRAQRMVELLEAL